MGIMACPVAFDMFFVSLLLLSCFPFLFRSVLLVANAVLPLILPRHDCHHISPGNGCPGCKQHFCYVCLRKHGLPGNREWHKDCDLEGAFFQYDLFWSLVMFTIIDDIGIVIVFVVVVVVVVVAAAAAAAAAAVVGLSLSLWLSWSLSSSPPASPSS